MKRNMISLNDFSIELLQSIIKYLDPIDLRKTCLINKNFYSACIYFINSEKWKNLEFMRKNTYPIMKEILSGNRWIIINNNISKVVNHAANMSDHYCSGMDFYRIMTNDGKLHSTSEKVVNIKILVDSKENHKLIPIALSLR
jgi:hypothetical protein